MKTSFLTLWTFLLAVISLSAADTAPTVTGQPKSQTVNAGTTVLFGVGTTGTVPLSFQWLKNGTPIAGASQSTYRIDSATVFDSGNYSVIVTNSFGSASSSNGQLTVVFYAINTNCTPAPSGLVSF